MANDVRNFFKKTSNPHDHYPEGVAHHIGFPFEQEYPTAVESLTVKRKGTSVHIDDLNPNKGTSKGLVKAYKAATADAEALKEGYANWGKCILQTYQFRKYFVTGEIVKEQIMWKVYKFEEDSDHVLIRPRNHVFAVVSDIGDTQMSKERAEAVFFAYMDKLQEEMLEDDLYF